MSLKLNNMEEYLKKKEEQKEIWLARVLAHGSDNQDQVMKEALEKFEKDYPPFK